MTNERITGRLFTGRNVSVVLDGKPYVISATSAIYDKVVKAVNDYNADALDSLLNGKKAISVATQGRIAYDGAVLSFNGEPIHNAIIDRLHFMWSRGLNYQALLRFLDNLMDNTSYRAVQETYGFLEACNLPITDDGHFLAYKMVRSDYTDIYTGKMDNSIGCVVEVPRNMVDEDSSRTCSHGLHCCSREYLFSGYGSYGGRTDRIVVVKVNPRDVVAVPSDYNNSKMRVCRYEVVSELTRDDLNLDEFYTDKFSPEVSDDDLFDDDDIDDFDDPFDDLEDELSDDTKAPAVNRSPVGQPIKLNEGAVRDIKRLLAQDELSIVNIARIYKVNESTIRKIRDGLIWNHVSI